jgi:hypothetical protein
LPTSAGRRRAAPLRQSIACKQAPPKIRVRLISDANENDVNTPMEIDFVTALGRLLQSGALRDAFAADPPAVARQIGVRESDRAAFEQLVPAELEAQAVVLLRKRFDLVRRGLPRTCAALGREAWPEFHSYARNAWPEAQGAAANDALGFCEALRRAQPEALCRIEYHRVRFLCAESRWSVRWLSAVPFRAGFRPGVQIFLRGPRSRWHEWVVYAGT